MKRKAPVALSVWCVLETDACCEPPTWVAAVVNTRAEARATVTRWMSGCLYRRGTFRIVRYVPAKARGRGKRQ